MSGHGPPTSAHHVLIRGLVQGVGFRWRTRELARAGGLTGWVRNLHDGRVELVVEGSAEAIEALLAQLAGPAGPGRVLGLESRAITATGATSFEVPDSAHTPESRS